MTGTFGGKVAPVTGADGGTGEAVAARLAGEGATTVAGARRTVPAEPLRGAHEAIERDVGDPGAIVRAVAGFEGAGA